MAEKVPEKSDEKVPKKAQDGSDEEWSEENAWKIKFTKKKPKIDEKFIFEAVHKKESFEWKRILTDMEEEFLPKNAPMKLKLDGHCPYMVEREKFPKPSGRAEMPEITEIPEVPYQPIEIRGTVLVGAYTMDRPEPKTVGTQTESAMTEVRKRRHSMSVG